jgi:cell division septation protein DedD
MDTPTKQRLVGAAVLVALAVIFLPMLVKGPAPDSGVSDVPLDMPRQPDDVETRELPLVVPQAGEGGVTGPAPVEGERLPTVDTADTPDGDGAAHRAAESAPGDTPMQPASVAGGDYAVHFGSYATRADASTIVGQLRGSQLPGYSEQATLDGRQVWRVRIGPYATRADAEAARLRAAHVRDDVRARVVVLDADGAAPSASGASQPVARADTAAPKTEPLPPEPATKPTSTAGAAAAKPEPKPASPPAAAPIPPAPKPAASGTGFAVQVGAFGNAVEATRLRDRLRAAGFTTFTETVNSDKGQLTRVRVGPVLSRAEADRLRAQLCAKAGVSGIVRPHP